jgi:glycosyltransferase 2 family protein
MNPKLKTILLSLAKFAIPAAIIVWLLWRMEPEEWQQLREQPKDYVRLSLALAIAVAAILLSFVRWWLLARCQGIMLSVTEACRLGAIGFLLSFVSAGSVGGDLFKAIFLAKRSPGKRFEAVASVVVDRGAGLLGLMLLVTAALALIDPKSLGDSKEIVRLGQATMLLAAVGLAVVAVLILGGKPIDRLIKWGSTWPVIGKLVDRVASPLRVFHERPFAFGLSLLMSVAVHIMLVVAIHQIACGLYNSPPTLADHFIIVPLANVAAALPIAPAGLGVTEMAMNWLYTAVPSSPTQASGTLVALVYELVKVIVAVLGMIFYWTAGRDVRSSLEGDGSGEVV